MAHRAQRLGLAVIGVLLALGPPTAGATTPSPRIAPAGGACTTSTGITVVVDFTAFGDGVQVRCAPQPVRSGFDALTRAGFTYQGTVRFPGLLCRIEGEPANDPCHGAPPPNAYWAYWHAPRGGDWTYSTSGAGSRVPPPGSVEGWAFGDDAEPGVDPPAPLATTTTRPSATTTTRATSGSTGGGTTAPKKERSGEGGTTTSEGGPAATGSTSPSEVDGSSTTATDGDVDPSGDDGDEDEVASPVAAGSSDSSGGGSPLGAVVGIAVAAGLGVAGLRSARRRRGVGEEPA